MVDGGSARVRAVESPSGSGAMRRCVSCAGVVVGSRRVALGVRRRGACVVVLVLCGTTGCRTMGGGQGAGTDTTGALAPCWTPLWAGQWCRGGTHPERDAWQPRSGAGCGSGGVCGGGATRPTPGGSKPVTGGRAACGGGGRNGHWTRWGSGGEDTARMHL